MFIRVPPHAPIKWVGQREIAPFVAPRSTPAYGDGLRPGWSRYSASPLDAPSARDRYRSIDAIGELAPLPVLIVHGEEDPVVPPEHARALYEPARPPKALWLVPGAGHIQAFTTPANRAELAAYLTQTLAGR